MPSPFPGLDPYLESQVWPEFHNKLISQLQDVLVPQVRPRYVVRIEEQVYVAHDYGDQPRGIRPDLTVSTTSTTGPSGARSPAVAPIELPIAMPEEEKHLYIEVRLKGSGQVVTVVEVLSPSNKRPHSEARRDFIDKRDAILRSKVHWVEMDLLRGGARTPMGAPLPAADHFVIVSRANRRPTAEVWPCTLRQSLPTLPLPLADADPDATLDLQAVFDTVYDRAGYDYSLDYTRALEPPLAPEDAAWVQTITRSSQGPAI